MKVTIKPNKSVINPAATVVDKNAETIASHNHIHDKDVNMKAPHMVAIAGLEDEKFIEHSEEVQEELNKMAENAQPKETEVLKNDKAAAGKARDYDYTHPVVDNIYTGKLILDESRATYRHGRKLSEADDLVKIAEDVRDKAGSLYSYIYDHLATAKRPWGEEPDGCGIYPEYTTVYKSVTAADIEKSVSDKEVTGAIKEFLTKELVKIINKITNNEELSNVEQSRWDSYSDDEQNLLKELASSSTDKQIEIFKPIYARKVAKEMAASNQKEIKTKAALKTKNTIEVNEDCGWEVIEIDGSVMFYADPRPSVAKSQFVISDKVIANNKWMNGVYTSEDGQVVTPGAPLKLDFAKKFLSTVGAKQVEESAIKRDVMSWIYNLLCYTIKGNAETGILTVYIPYGKGEAYVTKEEAKVFYGSDATEAFRDVFYNDDVIKSDDANALEEYAKEVTRVANDRKKLGSDGDIPENTAKRRRLTSELKVAIQKYIKQYEKMLNAKTLPSKYKFKVSGELMDEFGFTIPQPSKKDS